MTERRSLFARNGLRQIVGVDPMTGLSGRTFERTQGCWNCVHADHELAKTWWLDRRQKDLEAGVGLALESPQGEKDPKVVQIRRSVYLIDEAMHQGGLTKCKGPGLDANDNPVGDLVKTTYLCRNWSAAQGASVARAGEAPDILPPELDDKTK
jgi:hypothetical protein